MIGSDSPASYDEMLEILMEMIIVSPGEVATKRSEQEKKTINENRTMIVGRGFAALNLLYPNDSEKFIDLVKRVFSKLSPEPWERVEVSLAALVCGLHNTAAHDERPDISPFWKKFPETLRTIAYTHVDVEKDSELLNPQSAFGRELLSALDQLTTMTHQQNGVHYNLAIRLSQELSKSMCYPSRLGCFIMDAWAKAISKSLSSRGRMAVLSKGLTDLKSQDFVYK